MQPPLLWTYLSHISVYKKKHRLKEEDYFHLFCVSLLCHKRDEKYVSTHPIRNCVQDGSDLRRGRPAVDLMEGAIVMDEPVTNLIELLIDSHPAPKVSERACPLRASADAAYSGGRKRRDFQKTLLFPGGNSQSSIPIRRPVTRNAL